MGRRITSYATLDAPGVFVIGYYLDDGSGKLGDTLFVDLYQKSQGVWVTRQYLRSPGGDQRPLFGGSVVEIATAADCFLIGTHVNPSASLTLVVDKDLNFRDTLNGGELAVFPDGLVVYQHSEVHFAPTHYVELSVYDPRTQKRWQVYPQKPYQPLRQQHVEKVRAAYQKRGEEWSRKNNHHMNPELFDSFLRGEVAADGANHSLAFVIAFDNTDTWDYAEKLKAQNFGALAHSLAEFKTSSPPPEGLFEAFGEALPWLRRMNLRGAFLDLFQTDQETQEMIRKALDSSPQAGNDWGAHLISLDARWGQQDVWRKIQATLATPPETSDVICVFRNLDQEKAWEYRELLLSDFQKKFGDKSLAEYLKPETLDRIFAH